ncbi:MAG: Flp pilus assembly complex ATPase component [Gammaproteobacteria bacterium]|nr:Flp pilus assembly complex ATPase component [Gammaproteobacteria bacterium]
MIVNVSRRMLGKALIEKGVINQDQLSIALIEQKKRKIPLGKIFVKMGFVSEAIIRDSLGESLGQESVDLSKTVVDSDAISLIPKEIARRHRILPISFDGQENVLTVAMSDTFNVVALDQISAMIGVGVEIKSLLAAEADIEGSIDQFYGFELTVDGIINEIDTGEIDYQSLDAQTDEYSQPLVRLVDALLADAVKKGASDIHFEPERGFLRIRYRIDGVLRQVRTLHKNYWPGISVRLKVMSEMNIAEKRAPQDGRISRTLFGRPVDFRVAAQPTTHGENIVLRILDRQKSIVPIDALGLTDDNLSTLKLLMARPEGIILVTGPTGSGKTTTLYSMLNYVNDESVNIMTLEDPVEYPMQLIRQSSVNETVKMDFANGIRSIMRQDPDIILVGEIRDEDTAVMALRAAMTGHQVYSTLHTSSALGAIPRLLDIGIKPALMAGNIIGIVAQRLVRQLCQHCKESYRASEFEKKLMATVEDNITLHKANGCELCDSQGYRGRIALMEVMRIDNNMDDLIANKASRRELESAALSNGFSPLSEDGIRRVKEGLTSMEEVFRVVDLTHRVI